VTRLRILGVPIDVLPFEAAVEAVLGWMGEPASRTAHFCNVHLVVSAHDSPSVLEALERGDFYASTGVELGDLGRLDNGLRIGISEQRHVRYTTEFIGAGGKLLSRTSDNPAEYRLKPGEPYVRARVSDSNGWRAWVQPVFAR